MNNIIIKKDFSVNDLGKIYYKRDNNENREIDLLNIKPIFENQALLYINDELASHVGLVLKRGRLEISYGTEEKYRGKGYAKILVKYTIEWLFNNTKEDKIYALVDKNNFASINVLKKCGFSLESEDQVDYLYIINRNEMSNE